VNTLNPDGSDNCFFWYPVKGGAPWTVEVGCGGLMT